MYEVLTTNLFEGGMAEYECTPLQEKPTLKYVNRLHEIKRAICTLDESLTPSKRIGNKSIGLSPMFGTPLHIRNTESIALLDHHNVLTPSKTSLIDSTMGRDISQLSMADSILKNPEVAEKVEKITSANSLIRGFLNV